MDMVLFEKTHILIKHHFLYPIDLYQSPLLEQPSENNNTQNKHITCLS